MQGTMQVENRGLYELENSPDTSPAAGPHAPLMLQYGLFKFYSTVWNNMGHICLGHDFLSALIGL